MQADQQHSSRSAGLEAADVTNLRAANPVSQKVKSTHSETPVTSTCFSISNGSSKREAGFRELQMLDSSLDYD
jgi:hypothetical protein